MEIPCASIVVESGIIRRILEEDDRLPDAGLVYDATGAMALPGFFDIHCHGAVGFDVTDATLEAMEAIAEAKLSEGVTRLLATTLTLSTERLQSTVQAVSQYMDKQRYSKMMGVHLEGPYINAHFAGAQNPDYVRNPNAQGVLDLNLVAPIRIVTFAPEADGALEFARQLSSNGILPSGGHSDATYAQAMEAKRAGMVHLSHFCNAMRGVHHREIGLVGAGLLDDDLLVKLICDKVHLCPEMITLAFKMKPIERIALVTDAIAATGLQDGEYLLGGLPVRVDKGTARLVSLVSWLVVRSGSMRRSRMPGK